jgi:guanine deaminase
MSAGELLRATLFHTPANPFHDARALHCHTDGGLLVREGRIVMAGDYDTVRAVAPEATTLDWRGGFVLPGLIDTHVHFPQLRIIGSLGRTLLDWLEHVALPEESRMADFAYAEDTARGFVHALAAHGTTTALVFGAHFAPATAALFEQAAASGLRIISGLVLSDRLLRPELHQSPADAYRDSAALIQRFHRRGRLLYAVTPRFALSTSEAMLEVCRTLCSEHDGLRVQTHLNENVEEVAAVRRLFPWASDYLSVYERYGLSGPDAVMAHSVCTTDAELERLAARRTSVAHCPGSNAALGSGIFPFDRHLASGVHCALGTDVGGGIGFGILKEALQAYLMQRVTPRGVALDPARLLFLATRAGATALGLDHEVGDFQPGKAADLLYLRPPPDSTFAAVLDRVDSAAQALAALFTLAGADSVQEVRVAGAVVFQRDEDDRRTGARAAHRRPEIQ